MVRGDWDARVDHGAATINSVTSKLALGFVVAMGSVFVLLMNFL